MPDDTTSTTATSTATSTTDAEARAEAEVGALVERWTQAVRACDLGGTLAAHTDDVVMFDVPVPEEGHRGIAAYRDTWPPFFEYLRSDGHFDVLELDVTAGEDVAYVWALMRCGSHEAVAADPDRRLRLTIGLRREDGEWRIAHEHHSFADRS